jgi:hypothetical protein
MTKTMVRNSIARLINLDDDSMLEARQKIMEDLTIHYGKPQIFCHTYVWQLENGDDTTTITMDFYDFVIEIESEMTISDFIIDFRDKWIVAHIDCTTISTSDLINRICDIYKVDRIF